jgi:DNA polymerase-3 subunit gamma/tau
MSYEVLARKWRPQQFDDVVGQDHVVRTLRNAIATGRVAHAYLFVGPRGIGKTSIARLFAKALNCAKGPTDKPCDQCDSCREIALGTGLDVIEFDAASNTQVEKVRELIVESVAYAPTRGRYKVYLVDEVHMLSGSSFNALLKTLEEPPAHVVFLFATTEPERVPATIVSRCQRFDLRRIPVPLLIERLRHIGKSENVEIEENALLAIARGAEGGLRDAESSLDQLIAFTGPRIGEADVLSVFGLASRASLDALAELTLAGDVRGALEQVRSLDEGGKDLQRVVVELLEHFRNLLVYVCAGVEAVGPELTDAQREVLRRQAEGVAAGRVLRVVDILSDAYERMKYALSKRTLFDTALIRCARAATVVSLEEILAQIDALRQGGASDEIAAPVLAAAPSSPAPAARAPAPVPAAARIPDAADEVEKLRSGWRDVLDRVGRMAAVARAPLVDARPTAVEGSVVTVAFDPEFADGIAGFDSARNRMALEHALTETLGRPVRARLVAGGAPAAESARAPAESARAPAANRTDRTRDPAVRKVIEKFGGTIIGTRE